MEINCDINTSNKKLAEAGILYDVCPGVSHKRPHFGFGKQRHIVPFFIY